MKEKDIRKKLGISPGSTLTALVALAETVSPKAPWDAFAPLWLSLPWLKPGAPADEMWFATPKNVRPFAATGGEWDHFGFLMDGDLPTDERPIVYVDPTDDDDRTQIVAPSLRDLLGLIAISFGDVVSRSATDAEWFGFRTEWYGKKPAVLKEMERLSNLLCSLPGVVRPASPSKVANAYPDQTFRIPSEYDSEGKEEEFEEPRPADLANNVTDAQNACRFAGEALAQGRLDEAEHHARCGMNHPAFKPRCLLVLATIYKRTGRKQAAKSAARALFHAWLDPAPVSLPAVHPRMIIDRDDLISLLEQVEGAKAGPLIARVREAPEFEDPGGDYL